MLRYVVCGCFDCYSGTAGATNTTNSTSMGGLSGVQNNLSNMAAVASAMPNNINGLGNATAMAGAQTGVDALSQAYTGIQQYAGLSGLLNQGKVDFYPLMSFRQRGVQVCWCCPSCLCAST